MVRVEFHDIDMACEDHCPIRCCDVCGGFLARVDQGAVLLNRLVRARFLILLLPTLEYYYY